MTLTLNDLITGALVLAGGSQRRLLAQAMTRIAPELPQTGSE